MKVVTCCICGLAAFAFKTLGFDLLNALASMYDVSFIAIAIRSSEIQFLATMSKNVHVQRAVQNT